MLDSARFTAQFQKKILTRSGAREPLNTTDGIYTILIKLAYNALKRRLDVSK